MSTKAQGYRFEHGQIIIVTRPWGVASWSWPCSQRENLTMKVTHHAGAEGAWTDCSDWDFITANWNDGRVDHSVTVRVAWIVDRQRVSPDAEVKPSSEESKK